MGSLFLASVWKAMSVNICHHWLVKWKGDTNQSHVVSDFVGIDVSVEAVQRAFLVFQGEDVTASVFQTGLLAIRSNALARKS